jgi:hypothetical protein
VRRWVLWAMAVSPVRALLLLVGRRLFAVDLRESGGGLLPLALQVWPRLWVGLGLFV